MRILNVLQTNATLLDAEWCRFFAQHDFLIGASLDGPRELHDAYRVDKQGRPTFDRVLRGIMRLQAHNVRFNVLACVHAANADHALEIYHFLRDEVEAQFIQFIPIVEPINHRDMQPRTTVTARSVTGEQYGQFLITIFDEWVRRDVGRVFIQIFDVALAAWVRQPRGLCVFEETCGGALAMEHTGDVFSCDHFVTPSYRLGNIQQTPLAELVGSEQQQRFGMAKRDTLPQMCRKCPVRFACNGGCPKNRLLTTPDGEPGLNYLCEGYRSFFTHIDYPMRLMAAELSRGASPANVMVALAREDAIWAQTLATTGRNALCPCGSGRKFKHCHGAPGRNV